MKKILLILALLLLFALPVVIYASNDLYSLSSGEEHNANIYWAGERMIINGDVNGDIYVAAQDIEINGNVKGDVIFLANKSAIINGIIDGNVRGVVAEKISINGDIKRQLSVVAQNVYINEEAKVGATAIIFGSNVEMRGDISGNLDGGAESLFISGKLTHANVKVDTLVVSEVAEIRGNVNYEAVIEGDINENASIGGEVNFTESQIKDWSKYEKPGYFAGKFLKLLSLFILGLVVLNFFKKPTVMVIKKMKDDPVKAMLWGLLGFFAIPLLAIALAITIVGLPLTAILICSYIVILYISTIYSALVIGRWTAAKLKWKMTWPWALLLGLVILIILIALPFIGGLFFFMSMWWGMGGVLQVKKEYLQVKKD